MFCKEGSGVVTQGLQHGVLLDLYYAAGLQGGNPTHTHGRRRIRLTKATVRRGSSAQLEVGKEGARQKQYEQHVPQSEREREENVQKKTLKEVSYRAFVAFSLPSPPPPPSPSPLPYALSSPYVLLAYVALWYRPSLLLPLSYIFTYYSTA